VRGLKVKAERSLYHPQPDPAALAAVWAQSTPSCLP
jgi:hypothetical protein